MTNIADRETAMTKPKRKKRKPPKPPKVNKTEYIRMRVTLEDKAEMFARAEELGLDLSKLLVRSFHACKTGDPRRLKPLLPRWPVASTLKEYDAEQRMLFSESQFTPKPESQD